MVHTETISPDANSGIATFGTYLNTNNSIQGNPAATPLNTVKRAMRTRQASRKAHVMVNSDMGISAKNDMDNA